MVNAAHALAYFGEDIGAMMALVDRALALNPNFARGWHVSGVLRNWAGQHDIAIEHLDAALRLSPRARIGTSLSIIGIAHCFARRFDEAVPKLLLAMQDDPSDPTPYRYLAACYAQMGQLDASAQIHTVDSSRCAGSRLSRRRPGSICGMGTGLRRCGRNFDVNLGLLLPSESSEWI
jgi:adenylate cyclase